MNEDQFKEDSSRDMTAKSILRWQCRPLHVLKVFKWNRALIFLRAGEGVLDKVNLKNDRLEQSFIHRRDRIWFEQSKP